MMFVGAWSLDTTLIMEILGKNELQIVIFASGSVAPELKEGTDARRVQWLAGHPMCYSTP